MKKLLLIVANLFRKPPTRPEAEPFDRPATLVAGNHGLAAQTIAGPVFASLGGGWIIRELTTLQVLDGFTTIKKRRYLVSPTGHAWAWRRGWPVQVPSIN